MSNIQPIFSEKQRTQLHQRGWTALGKRIHGRIERNRMRNRHPHFASQRYALFVEHDSAVVDENGDKAEPVVAVIVTATNIRAARSKAIQKFPAHIRRFLHWKHLPLYPINEEEVVA